MEFTYVLAGWEGSANDFTVLKDALRRPNGLKVPEGDVIYICGWFYILLYYRTLLDVSLYYR